MGTSVLAVAGVRRPPIDLGFLGFPGCVLHVPPDLTLVRPLGPGSNGSAGTANHVVRLPTHATMLGVAFAIQGIAAWIDGTNGLRLATSPALDLTTASRMPALDAAMVSSLLLGPTEPWPNVGRVQMTRIPVIQLTAR